jgi:hypothetical protein
MKPKKKATAKVHRKLKSKKSPNVKLIALLQGPKPIPYNPELFEAMSRDFQQSWNELEQLRLTIYYIVLPWFRAAKPERIQTFAV